MTTTEAHSQFNKQRSKCVVGLSMMGNRVKSQNREQKRRQSRRGRTFAIMRICDYHTAHVVKESFSFTFKNLFFSELETATVEQPTQSLSRRTYQFVMCI